MQDTSTGELIRLRAIQNAHSDLQAAKDEAVPNREHQGPVFYVGQELEIDGGKFRVHNFGKRFLMLESLPKGAA